MNTSSHEPDVSASEQPWTMLDIKREAGGAGGGPIRILRRDLDIHDYLDAAAEAAHRTRTVNLAMVVASVLIFVAWMNSRPGAWMAQRLETMKAADSAYLTQRIGTAAKTGIESEYRKLRYEQLYAALMEHYVEHSFYVRVPFFGFAFDANDLGTIGGLAFVIILAMYYLCLAREVWNLETAFEHVRGSDRMLQFYTLLSMRQVFTVPRGHRINPSPIATHAPKAIWIAPFVVQLLVTINDVRTTTLGGKISVTHTTATIWLDIAFLIAILFLTAVAIIKMKAIDDIWDNYWYELQPVVETSRGLSFSRRLVNAIREFIILTFRPRH